MSDLQNEVKTVLVVEDEPEIQESIKKIFRPYEEKLHLLEVQTAKHALDILYPEKEARRVDAMIMDIMIPYGDKKTREALHGEGDVSNLETGILLLQYIREQEKTLGQPSLWVNGITGRNAPHVLKEFDKSLKGKGRLLVKPFNDFLLENDITLVIGLDSKVPEILLPQGYLPPSPLEKNNGL